MTLSCGLRHPPYMGDWLMSSGVSAYAPALEEAKFQQRLGDGTLLSAYAQPYSGCPRKCSKMQFSVRFDRPTASDKERLLMLSSYSSSFDFCPWTAISEQWYNSASGTSQRRDALTVITDGADRPGGDPTNEFKAYTLIDRTTAGVVTWGAVDAVNYRQEWSTSGTITNKDVYLIYFPVYRVVLVDYQVEIPNDASTREVWTLALAER